MRDYVRFPASDDDFNAFLSEFQQESDRAAAVLGAAYADDLLKTLLMRSFVNEGRTVRELMRPESAGGTFSSRISLAYAIGLISEDDAKDLHRLREIRNKFAHRLHGLSFEDQSIAANSWNFRCMERVFTKFPRLREEYPPDARKWFDLAVGILCYQLRRSLRNASRFTFVESPLAIEAPEV